VVKLVWNTLWTGQSAFGESSIEEALGEGVGEMV
jgi:hypothetical protein